MGDSIATNLFMVGYAWQRGLIPLGEASIVHAIELNGAAVESNKKAFEWGRRAAVDLPAVARAATPPEGVRQESLRLSDDLDELIARRRAFLVDYQNEKYAERYARFVAKVQAVEATQVPGSTALTQAVARYLFKLMAYKDEYEVARLHTQTGFRERIAEMFEGDYEVKMHLAPPLWVKTDPATGEPRKRTYGAGMYKAMQVLASLRGLRGSVLDVFGYQHERRTERALIGEYEAIVNELLEGLTPANHALAVDIASIPEFIRGFGPVKARHLKDAKSREAALLAQWRSPAPASSMTRIPIKAAA
jgi:indolepyruvate ferredoxin oxidoreductase